MRLFGLVYGETLYGERPLCLLNRSARRVDFMVTDGGEPVKWSIQMDAIRSFDENWDSMPELFYEHAHRILAIANRKLQVGSAEPDGSIIVSLRDLQGAVQ